MVSPLEQEPEVQQALAKLIDLLSEHESIKEFKKIQAKAVQNEHLKELEAAIKAAQKDAVQYAHYNKPEAEKQAIERINALNKEYAEHPLVIAYREKLIEADELLQYVTSNLQRQVNQSIEEEN
ncbi:YlbF family regulator [Enterococcus saccharolyticus]|uniref:YlbF family regulator n=1 Tax=Enterococcus TaxID=1350 RepID=UPI001E501283|nr:YlbF family regulator [Enterococcus saccharolyticus]MCD5002166.1 YlbF family regulator [Enterococcus saccharolyticus]